MQGRPASEPAVAVVDDGELQDVRHLLDELGAEFTHCTKASTPGGRREPRQLLVAAAPLAVALGYERSRRDGGEHPVWIAITATESRPQRSHLLQAGFDYLVRRPVHPTALRLLIRHALYRGNDHRSGSRVAVGYGIRYRAGLRSRRATLVDLSPGGCRMLCGRPVAVGAKLRLSLPVGRDGGRSFTAHAVVVRTRRGDLEGGDADEHSVAMRFTGVTRVTQGRIRALLATLVSGPARADADVEGAEEVAAPPLPAWMPRAPRASFEGRVAVFGEAECVLVGRDLSARGMRVDPHPALSVGDRVRLALPLGPREEPLLVHARVARDDGPLGLALTFDAVDDDGVARLQSLVSSLPAIESLVDVDAEGRVTPSRLLPRLLRVTQEPPG